MTEYFFGAESFAVAEQFDMMISAPAPPGTVTIPKRPFRRMETISFQIPLCQ